jgi:hypothetical protein
MTLRRVNRRLHLLETRTQDALDTAAREQVERNRPLWPHAYWIEPQPDGTRRQVAWEPWMGSWPVVASLIDNLGIAAHDDLTRFGALCAKYQAMMARRPVEGNEDEAE